MNQSEALKSFWRNFCRENPETRLETPYQIWFFGNSSEMARELAALVLAGKKSATASLVEFNEAHPEESPVANGYSIVTDFEGRPQCVIQTTEIRAVPFDEVDARFAFDEGEGDRTLEYWRAVHRRYFTSEAAENGLEFHEKSLICCERFRLLFAK